MSRSHTTGRSLINKSARCAYDKSVDLTTVVTPGAQSLVTAILTDSWGHVRNALSRLWAHTPAGRDPSNLDTAAVEAAGTELDLAKQLALTAAGNGPEPERATRMELFWAGYLAGQIAARPEFAETVRALPGLLDQQQPTSLTAVTNNKTFSGTAQGNVVQADDVSGGIRFGR